MGWFGKQVEDAIRNILTDIKEALLGFANDIFEEALLNPIVGVPAPESNSRYIVVGTPENAPWQSLYADFYLQYILPLTIMLLIVGFAYIGLRSGSISPYRRKRLLRRIGLVFMGSFVWFPLVSIRSSSSMRSDSHLLQSTICRRGSGVSSSLVSVASSSFSPWLSFRTSLLIVAALVYGLRWLGILVLTPLMPLLGVFWGTRRVATQSGLGDRTPRSRHLSRTRACGTSCCSPFQNRLADESHSECRWPLLPVPWTRAHPSGVSRLDYDRLLVCPCGSDNCSAGERAKRIRWLPPQQRNQARENLFVVPGTCIGDTPRTKLAR